MSPVESFARPFGRLAIANILSNLMVPLAGMIDTAFLGHLSDIRHLAGVAIATVIFNIVYWSFGFLRMGTTGLTAQAYGRQDTRATFLILGRNGMIALALGGSLLLLQTPIRQLGFWLLSAPPEVRQAGEAFYNARIWGAPAVLLNYVLLGWFLGQGQGRRVIALSLIGNGSNILLDGWFIRHLRLASAGAGAATALSQGLMLLAGVIFVSRDWRSQAVGALSPALWQVEALKGLFRLNRDILIRTFALVMSFALFTHWSATLGTETLAANTLLLQVVTLTSYFVDGLAFATESFAGQFYGVGDRDRLRALLAGGLVLSITLGVGVALTFMVLPEPLFGLMTQHAQVIEHIKAYVGWLVPTLGFGAIAFLLDGYFLGLTAGKILRTSTLTAALCGFLPFAYLGYQLGTPQLLWFALTSFMATRAITLARFIPQSLPASA